ncbi:MAG: DUF4412 domain-containing protein, partial [Woeseiaceae bacterium]
NASFSGTRHMEMKEGQIDSFVRQAPGKMRMEMTTAGMSAVIITRQDTGKNYMLMPSMSMYREMDIKGLQEAGSSDVDFTEASKVGREAINGFDCTKYKAKFKDKQGGKGGGYYWVSDEGILMKVDMIYQSRKQKGQRMVFVMRDVQIGPQDPSQFEVPANYSKMGFGSMMGQNLQTQGGGYEEPELDEQIADAVEDETEQAVVDEARNSVRKGLSKLFKK